MRVKSSSLSVGPDPRSLRVRPLPLTHPRSPPPPSPQAQDNIVELNKSRLRALEELKTARQKIAELGGSVGVAGLVGGTGAPNAASESGGSALA